MSSKAKLDALGRTKLKMVHLDDHNAPIIVIPILRGAGARHNGGADHSSVLGDQRK